MRLSKQKKVNVMVNINVIYFLFVILIFLGKLVRFTIMKAVLVDTAIAHALLPLILDSNGKFTFFEVETIVNEGGNTVVIYRVLNVLKLDTIMEFEWAVTIVFNLVILFILMRIKEQLTLTQVTFIALSIIVLNIFDFTLAKEPIQMFYFILIYFVLVAKFIPDKMKYVLCIAIILFSAAAFRTYYVLIAFFTVCAQIICEITIIRKDKVTIKSILVLVFTIGFIYFIFLNVCKVASTDNYDNLIRVRTRVSSARSDMRNILPTTNLVLFCLDYMIMLFRMIAPVELLPLGIKYLPYVLYQFIMTYFVVDSMIRIRENSYQKNITLFIYLGYLFGSATFEPDFGSWVRHEAVLFPLYLILSDSTKD